MPSKVNRRRSLLTLFSVGVDQGHRQPANGTQALPDEVDDSPVDPTAVGDESWDIMSQASHGQDVGLDGARGGIIEVTLSSAETLQVNKELPSLPTAEQVGDSPSVMRPPSPRTPKSVTYETLPPLPVLSPFPTFAKLDSPVSAPTRSIRPRDLHPRTNRLDTTIVIQDSPTEVTPQRRAPPALPHVPVLSPFPSFSSFRSDRVQQPCTASPPPSIDVHPAQHVQIPPAIGSKHPVLRYEMNDDNALLHPDYIANVMRTRAREANERLEQEAIKEDQKLLMQERARQAAAAQIVQRKLKDSRPGLTASQSQSV